MAQAKHYCVVRTDESDAAFKKALCNVRDESTSLARAVGFWYETIKGARVKRISWDTIAAEMCKATGATGISGKAICEAFKRVSTARHKRRQAASLSDRFAAARELIAEAKRVGIKDVDKLIDERVPAILKKRQEQAAQKAVKKKASKEEAEGEKRLEFKREKMILSMYLQEQWRKIKNSTEYPSWMLEGLLNLDDAKKNWQIETGEALPEEILTKAF
ncbi:MAG: hypothetical protein IK079_06040 [Desulfovibrio sp.]|nr:hypothetical protein [Desulfovibrio sp.]